jgi:hypothetical protein
MMIGDKPDHLDSDLPPDPRSPEQRLNAYRRGEVGPPNWGTTDPVFGRETTLFLSEEEIVHPEIRPLICLSNMDEQGEILGEVWFTPADIPAIIESFQWELAHNYRSGQRRWLGNIMGPALYFGDFGKADVVDKETPSEDADSDEDGKARFV